MKRTLLTFLLLPFILLGQDYQDVSGIISMQAEDLNLVGNWTVSTAFAGYTGSGYIVSNTENFPGSNAGIDVISTQLKINVAGTYRVQFNHAITVGSSTTDNNDTWLRFPDANNFYGRATSSSGTIYYPKGWNKTPLIAGETDKGWMKVYKNSLAFGYVTRTYDSAPIDIFVTFNTPGIYHMELSNRSANHGIDKIILWNTATSNETAAIASATTPFTVSGANGNNVSVVSGELRRYHKTTITWNGLFKDEKEATFKNHRLNVIITSPTGIIYTVPGYFAADGNAGETGAVAGNQWKAHFLPVELGTYTYTTDFRLGTNVAASLDAIPAGSTTNSIHGNTGSFVITETNKTGKDFRSKGKLEYVGKSFSRFSNGEYFYKIGADSPEVFLEYADIDNTFAPTRTYPTHLAAWSLGQPQWKAAKGRSIIGAINYLASQDQKVHYFLVMNAYGDGGHIGTGQGKGGEVHPWVGSDSYYRYDTSKLAQWEIIFDYMVQNGMMPHMVLSEQENQNFFEQQEGGTMSNARKIYYRELVARFGYLNAITYNIGEESGWTAVGKKYGLATTTTEMVDFAAHLDALTPYNDNITIHNGPSDQNRASLIYNSLLGTGTKYTGITFQGNLSSLYPDGIDTYDRLKFFLDQSLGAGKQWVINYDEPWSSGVLNTPTLANSWRKQALWTSIMAGSAGVEFYYGGAQDLLDQNYATYVDFWTYQRNASSLFYTHNIPLWEMVPDRTVVNGAANLALKKNNQAILGYLPAGGTGIQVTTGNTATYTVKWYNPRTGGDLLNGTVTSITGGTNVNIGNPPNTTTEDWVFYVFDPTIGTTGMFDPGEIVIQDEDVSGNMIFKNNNSVVKINSGENGIINKVFNRKKGLDPVLGQGIAPTTISEILITQTTVRVEFTFPQGSEGQIEWMFVGGTWGVNSFLTTREMGLLLLHRQNINVGTANTNIVYRIRGKTPNTLEYTGVDKFIGTIPEATPDPIDPDFPSPWVSECSTCPNNSINLSGLTTYVPASASDLSNPANANKVAIITNSFSITNTTLAANQIIQPNGGELSGTGINLNGARIIMNDLKAFSPAARFSVRYNECLTPELFGADLTVTDKTAIEAMLLNGNMGRNKLGGSYNLDTKITLPTTVRTFKWVGNNSTILNTSTSTNNADYMFTVDGVRLEMCDLHVDINQKNHSGFSIKDTDFYVNNLKVGNAKFIVNSDKFNGIRHDFYSSTARDTKIHNSEFYSFVAGSATITTGAGATRGLLVRLFEVDTNPTTIKYEVRDSKFHEHYGEGDGIHFQSVTDSNQDNDIIFIVDGCQFWENNRRDIKTQTGGLHATRNIFTKIDSRNPNSKNAQGGWVPTSNVSVSLRDVVLATEYHRNAKIIGNTFKLADGDTEGWSVFLGLSHTLNAIVKNNTFTRTKAGPFMGVSFGNKNPGAMVTGNVFFNVGVGSGFLGMDAVGTVTVANNSITYDGNFWKGYYTGVISFGSSSSNASIRNLNFNNNEIFINIPNSTASTYFKGILATRPAWSAMQVTGITLNNNDITYTGELRGNTRFLFLEQSLGNTNTISNHVVKGITALNAFEVNGTDQSFISTANTNDLGQTLTKL